MAAARSKRVVAPASRKEPRQARAQVTVNGILEATALVLDREGLDAASTTRIAEVAGVSIGSLYQYFAHRDAILGALQDRELERAVAMMQTILADTNVTRSPREIVTAVVRGLAALYAAAPGLHRVLAIEGLRVTQAPRVHAFDARVVAIIVHFLASTRAPLRRTRLDVAAFVAFQSVRATMLAALLERPDGLDPEVLVDEMVDLLMQYLVEPEATIRSRLRSVRDPVAPSPASPAWQVAIIFFPKIARQPPLTVT